MKTQTYCGRSLQILVIAVTFSLFSVLVHIPEGNARGGAGGGSERRSESGGQRRSGGMDSGGGSRCEADFKLTLHTLAADLERYAIPLPQALIPATLPEIWKSTKITVVSEPIAAENSVEWKFAWADRPSDEITLFCLEDDDTKGWFRLSSEIKEVLVLHELLWWFRAIPDGDFETSPGIIASLLEKKRAEDHESEAKISSSIYLEIADGRNIAGIDDVYFTNVRALIEAINTLPNRRIDPKSLGEFRFSSAIALRSSVEYIWTIHRSFSQDSFRSQDCTLRLSFRKSKHTSRLSDISLRESCTLFDARED